MPFLYFTLTYNNAKVKAKEDFNFKKRELIKGHYNIKQDKV